MRKAKFWLCQIAMLAILGLVFGSPVLADPPEGKGRPDFAGKNQTNADENSNGKSSGADSNSSGSLILGGGSGGGNTGGGNTGGGTSTPDPCADLNSGDWYVDENGVFIQCP